MDLQARRRADGAGLVTGLVTVTVFAPAGLTVQVNDAVPDGPVESVAVTVTDEVPAVVGVPEIRPVEALIDRPAGSPVAA